MSLILAGGRDPPDSLEVDAWFRRALDASAKEAATAHYLIAGLAKGQPNNADRLPRLVENSALSH